ncbi:hypothetical protein MKX53_18870 [Psychrobacillus sp. FSL K6-4615]|uniref:hypothetical protein n=1 Tax=Psychrobacillus sp. FSL K6-4615 TaxID=2921551 RepID=UPI0030FCDC0A
MKFTGKILRLSKDGKLRIPKKILKRHYTIDTKNPQVEIFLSSDMIVIQPYKTSCAVTGKKSENLIELLPEFFVSQEGMKLLLYELKKNFNN